MSKPTFLFIPGAFHRPIIYDSIRARLSTHGYESTAVPLPSVGANPPTDDMSDDVYAIRSAAGTLLTQGKEVILVTHSYGGFPVGEALEGLGGRGRDQKNLQGGIIRLVYIAAGVLPESGQLGQRGDASLLPPFLKCDVETGIVTMDLEVSNRHFYGDGSDEDAAHWASLVQPQSLGPYWTKTTYASWRHIPTTFVYCEQDKALPHPFVKMKVTEAKEAGPHMIDVEETGDSGHFPFPSQQDWTEKMLRRAAGQKIEEMA